MLAGSRSWYTWIFCPFTTSCPPSSLTSPVKRPCVESYLIMYTMYPTSMNGSLTAVTSTPFRIAARSTSRPIRPKPLIPIFTIL